MGFGWVSQGLKLAVYTESFIYSNPYGGLGRAMLTLRDYQREALNAWRAGGCYGAVVMPTGTGKTYLGLEAIREELEAGGRAAVVVPTIALAHQWRRRVQGCLGLFTGLYCNEERSLARATVFVVNSAYLNMYVLNTFTLAVIDETHHLGAPRWSTLLRSLRGRRVLGLTATPERCPLPVIYQMGVSSGQAAQGGGGRGYKARLRPAERRGVG